MDDTIQIKTILTHMQDKNLSGNIFGGFLMREAYELGWICASLHC
jgi:acyl-coenzyme A thioesterase 9